MTLTTPGPNVLYPLKDRHGRRAVDLRVSLTDRCNLRCTYCMPAEGMQWLSSETVLTATEIVRLVRIGVELCGITEVRLTGGEPLVRPETVEIVAEITSLTPRPEVSLTTNGILLGRHVDALVAAGLNRVNVSLDTLQPARFRQLTRRGGVESVLDAIAACQRAGIGPVKINAVLMRGINEGEACDLLQYAIDHQLELRFIEQMPLDGTQAWRRDSMITAAEMIAQLETRFSLAPTGARGSSPAEHFVVNGGPARVGIIASVTQPFCGACDRTRITADGQLRSCLFSSSETDPRTLLRAGAEDDEIAATWAGTMLAKDAGHAVGTASFTQPTRTMSAIGG